jgi:hypothetical protein
LAIFALGAVKVGEYYRLSSHQESWKVLETCTSAGDEPDALGVAERTFQTVADIILAASSGDDEIEYYIVPPTWNNIRLTAIGITDDGTYTVDIHAGTLPGNITNDMTVTEVGARLEDCNLTKIGTLAFIIGQQASTTSTYEMAQSVTVTTLDATTSWTSAGTVDGDRTAEATIDLQGANVLVIVPTTCSANSKLLGKGY